jgi:hypothetical protein
MRTQISSSQLLNCGSIDFACPRYRTRISLGWASVAGMSDNAASFGSAHVSGADVEAIRQALH